MDWSQNTCELAQRSSLATRAACSEVLFLDRPLRSQLVKTLCGLHGQPSSAEMYDETDGRCHLARDMNRASYSSCPLCICAATCGCDVCFSGFR